MHQLCNFTLDDISARFYLPNTNRHWRGTIYRDNLISTSYESVVEFLAWLKKLLVSENEIVRKAALKQSISPGFPENPTKCVDVEVFSISAMMWCYQIRMEAVQKRDHLSFMSATNPKYSNCGDRNIMNGHITQDNIFGMADCSALSTKAKQKVEYWISLQDTNDVSTPNLWILLSSIGHHRNTHAEWTLFEVMLVKGIETMSLLRIPHLPPAVFSWVLQAVARWGRARSETKFEYLGNRRVG